jgi:hypothetical protein
MRRKVLNNTAFTLCHMFRGWQLADDYAALTRLGSGTLEIDVLRTECRHNGGVIPTLHIAHVLQSWLRDDLEHHHVPNEAVEDVRLMVALAFDRHEGQRKPAQRWARPTREFVGCAVLVRCRLRTDEATYTAECRDELEWPLPGAA